MHIKMKYCKNCKWYKPGVYVYLENKCYIETNKTLSTGEKEYKAYNTEIKNKNFSCKDYKRIWWKFWIKES